MNGDSSISRIKIDSVHAASKFQDEIHSMGANTHQNIKIDFINKKRSSLINKSENIVGTKNFLFSLSGISVAVGVAVAIAGVLGAIGTIAAIGATAGIAAAAIGLIGVSIAILIYRHQMLKSTHLTQPNTVEEVGKGFKYAGIAFVATAFIAIVLAIAFVSQGKGVSTSGASLGFSRIGNSFLIGYSLGAINREFIPIIFTKNSMGYKDTKNNLDLVNIEQTQPATYYVYNDDSYEIVEDQIIFHPGIPRSDI